MRAHIVFCLCLALAGATACTAGSSQRTFTLQGQIISLDRANKRVTVKHEAIKGFMSAMTMGYAVKDEKLLDGLAPGDLITATLVVLSDGAYLSAIKKVGQVSLEKPSADAPAPIASFGFKPLSVGDAVPNAAIAGADGTLTTGVRGSAWRIGQRLANPKRGG